MEEALGFLWTLESFSRGDGHKMGTEQLPGSEFGDASSWRSILIGSAAFGRVEGEHFFLWESWVCMSCVHSKAPPAVLVRSRLFRICVRCVTLINIGGQHVRIRGILALWHHFW